MDGAFGPASANVLTSDSAAITGVNTATASFTVHHNVESLTFVISSSTVSATTFVAQTTPNTDASDDTVRFFARGATTSSLITNFKNEFNSMTKFAGFTATDNKKAVAGGTGIIEISASSAGTAGNGLSINSGSFNVTTVGGTDTAGSSTTCFTLETLADGTIMNNADSTSTTNHILVSGSKHNVRFEVASVNNNKGTFSLLVRAGNDSIKRKQTLETYNNLSLDPNSPNFITKVIGDQKQNLKTDNGVKYLQLSGSYPNASRFVRVKNTLTLNDYLDENGNVRVPANSSSLPQAGSGSSNGGFTGGTDGQVGFDALGNMNGSVSGKVNFYEDIGTQSQGLAVETADQGKTGYENALDLLANQDEFDINLILLPGVIDSLHTSVSAKAIDVCEDRGDCFAVIDPVPFDSTLSAATTRGEARDSNFAAMYWPWVKVPDSQVAGTQRWVPPSVTIGGIYAFNDRVAHPWFAPAGLNRGGITTAIQAERKLTQGNRDDLYDSNINPIATFPGQGVTVFGQKTLQKKPSALDRINVRRLLIRVKKFIASSSRFLVFEQNTASTRRRFLGIVNPFLEQVQSQSGLSAFRVVMDETNNTPDTIDRNQLVGQLFLQPTRTAEFIVLDFTIQPTGASFPE